MESGQPSAPYTDGRVLSLLSTTTVFGTANDITLAELTLESFFPADEFTRKSFSTLTPNH